MKKAVQSFGACGVLALMLSLDASSLIRPRTEFLIQSVINGTFKPEDLEKNVATPGAAIKRKWALMGRGKACIRFSRHDNAMYAKKASPVGNFGKSSAIGAYADAISDQGSDDTSTDTSDSEERGFGALGAGDPGVNYHNQYDGDPGFYMDLGLLNQGWGRVAGRFWNFISRAIDRDGGHTVQKTAYDSIFGDAAKSCYPASDGENAATKFADARAFREKTLKLNLYNYGISVFNALENDNRLMMDAIELFGDIVGDKNLTKNLRAFGRASKDWSVDYAIATKKSAYQNMALFILFLGSFPSFDIYNATDFLTSIARSTDPETMIKYFIQLSIEDDAQANTDALLVDEIFFEPVFALSMGEDASRAPSHQGKKSQNSKDWCNIETWKGHFSNMSDNSVRILEKALA